MKDLRLVICQLGSFTELFHPWHSVIYLPEDKSVALRSVGVIADTHQVGVGNTAAVARVRFQAIEHVEAIIPEVCLRK